MVRSQTIVSTELLPTKSISKLHLKKFRSAKALETERKKKSLLQAVESWMQDGKVPEAIIDKLLQWFHYLAKEGMEYELEDSESVIMSMVIYGDRVVKKKGLISVDELPLHLFVSNTSVDTII
jgi:hypothetical protein